MSKNIVICLDGTWNDKDDSNTLSNVALLHDMCNNIGTKQITYYDSGVGTNGWYDAKLGGLHGVGLSKNVREAYSYLVKNYQMGDCVFIIGFSRGAFTARSLTGLVYRCGLLYESDGLPFEVKKIYEAYKDKDQGRMNAYKSINRKCPIEMLGVWDTVGALGIPVSFLKAGSEKVFGFHDMDLSPDVKYACHAIAIDEKRESFEPTLWKETADNRHRIKQVWFPGVHADVGGGYAERHHSDQALKWMVEQANTKGLLIKQDSNYDYHIDLSENIHDSAFKIFDIEIGDKERVAQENEAGWPRVHQSVRDKMHLNANYKPLALMKHLEDPQTLAPYEIEE